MVNSAGNVVSGPYCTSIGISGGTRGDQHSPSVSASLKTAVTNNLSSIIGQSVGGTVQIDGFDHSAQCPDIYV